MSQPRNKAPIIIAIDGTSASGKSTNSKLVAKALNFVHVDTGAMYRTLAWYCLRHDVDVQNARAVGAACRRWKTALKCSEGNAYLVVDGCYPVKEIGVTLRALQRGNAYLVVDGCYPVKEIRTAEVSAAVPHVAAVPKVREWMKKTQRDCIKFGSLVMEGRDIGTNVFPETDFKYYLDAQLAERSRRRAADGIQENLAARDQRDSQRAAAPLMIALGAKVINNSQMTSEQTSTTILTDIKKRMAEREKFEGRKHKAEGR